MQPRHPRIFKLGLVLLALAAACWASVIAGAPQLVGAAGGAAGSLLALAALAGSQPIALVQHPRRASGRR